MAHPKYHVVEEAFNNIQFKILDLNNINMVTLVQQNPGKTKGGWDTVLDAQYSAEGAGMVTQHCSAHIYSDISIQAQRQWPAAWLYHS